MVMVFHHSSKAGESGEGQKLHVLPFIQQNGRELARQANTQEMCSRLVTALRNSQVHKGPQHTGS